MESIYGQLNTEARWYALHTRNRHEKKVNERLEQKKITSFLPLYSTIRYWSDRKKKVTEPLFNCYLFVKIALKDRMPVLQTDGAVNLVTFNNVPVPIPENQIAAIQRLLSEKAAVQVENTWQPGQHVRIIRGPLQGLEGILQQTKGKSRLVIAIDGIKQAVSVEVDGDVLEVVGVLQPDLEKSH
jgi:transcription antitermination factor NusG